jgi:predicted acylesterase/phospholipase RssA
LVLPEPNPAYQGLSLPQPLPSHARSAESLSHLGQQCVGIEGDYSLISTGQTQRGKMDNAVDLAMTGVGARGAYQAGVLKRIGEVKRVQTQGNSFPIIGGSSAGAFSGSALAAGGDDSCSATKAMARLWSDLKPSDIFRCEVLSQIRNSRTTLRRV